MSRPMAENPTAIPSESKSGEMLKDTFESSSVFGHSHGFEASNHDSRAQFASDPSCFFKSVGGSEKGNVLAGDFFGGIPVHQFGAFVPTGDLMLQIGADDCVLRRFHDGGELHKLFFCQQARGKIAYIHNECRVAVDQGAGNSQFRWEFLRRRQRITLVSRRLPINSMPLEATDVKSSLLRCGRNAAGRMVSERSFPSTALREMRNVRSAAALNSWIRPLPSVQMMLSSDVFSRAW